MKVRARRSHVLGGGNRHGRTPVVPGPAARRLGSWSVALCLTSSLLASMAVSADATDDFFWEVVKGCKEVAGTRKYLGRYPEGLHAEEARECLEGWQEEEQIAWDRIKSCDDIGAVKRFLQELEFPESRYAGEASECITRDKQRREESERRELVERRLNECRAHQQAGRISEGLGGSALECFRKVLDDDPGNPEALKGIEDIVTYYSNKADLALDSGRPDAAEREIGRLERIVPESSEVEALRGRLEGLKREIAEYDRIERERKALHAKAERLFEQGEYEKVVDLVSAERKDGLDDKRLRALNQRAEDALWEEAAARSLEVKVVEVRTHLGRADFDGARASLEEAKGLGLNDETHGALTAEINDAEREARVSESRALREHGDYEAAREGLRRARELGLSDARYKEEMERIDHLEAVQLLSACREYEQRHEGVWRWEEALECVRRVRELDPDNAEAHEAERRLEMLAAFSRVHQSPSVEGYYKFMKDYSWSPFVDVAREELKESEGAYWEEVKRAAVRERYERYLEIYPEGRHAGEARRWLSGGG